MNMLKKKFTYTLLQHEFYENYMSKKFKKERICKKTLLYKPKSLLVETSNAAVSSHTWKRF